MKTATSFKPGQPRPPNAGRKKGTPNKKTLEIARVLETLKIDPLKSLSVLLPQLDEDKQADVYLKLLEYLYPKRKAIEHSVDDSGGLAEMLAKARARAKGEVE